MVATVETLAAAALVLATIVVFSTALAVVASDALADCMIIACAG